MTCSRASQMLLYGTIAVSLFAFLSLNACSTPSSQYHCLHVTLAATLIHSLVLLSSHQFGRKRETAHDLTEALRVKTASEQYY